MNTDNVVLVRAMNNLPLNGELIPSYEGVRLVRDHQSDFYYFIREYIINNLEQQLGRNLQLYNDSPDSQLVESIISEYEVLTGGYYTTTLSFALNGLVPNDRNNQFSNMKMAVLEPIKNQLNADFVTIETIDTTVKGRMKLSNEAILVIEREFFSQLLPEEQENLVTNFDVKLFDGELKEAISNTLKEKGYPVLPLVQKRELRNIEDCLEKESMLEFEDKFSAVVGASRVTLDLLTYRYAGSKGVDAIAHSKISEEFKNTLKVEQYYKQQLYSFLLNKAEGLGIQVSEPEKNYLFTNTDAMKRITISLIEAYGGFENFKQFINEYNQYTKDNYLTNKQIVSLSNNKTMN